MRAHEGHTHEGRVGAARRPRSTARSSASPAATSLAHSSLGSLVPAEIMTSTVDEDLIVADPKNQNHGHYRGHRDTSPKQQRRNDRSQYTKKGQKGQGERARGSRHAAQRPHVIGANGWA